MKRVVYSYAAKTIAFLLVIASAALGSYKAVELLTAIENEYGVYHFESDFYESDVFNNALVAPFGIMMNIDYDNEEEKRAVGNMLRSAGAEYYMEADGVVIMSNTQNTDPAYYENSKYSLTMEKNAGEEAVFGGGMSDRITESFMNGVYYDFQNRSDSDECRIYIRLDETCVRDIETVWYQGQRLAQDSLIYCFCSMIVCAAALIYLLCVCGRSSKDNDIHMLLIDRMFVEITAGLTIIASFCTAGAVITLADALLSTNSVEKMLLLCIPITAAAGMGLVTALLMSLVRNAKNRSFLKRSLIIWAAKAIILLASRVWAYLGKSFGHIKEAFISFFRLACRDRLAAMAAAALTLYTFAAVILGMLLLAFIDSAGATLFVFVLVIAMFATAMYRLVKGFGAFDKIKEGIFKIRAGDISYKITDVGTGVSGDIAEAVNNIGDGLAESVKTKIRAERMKAELITNVSHDLKTPLTSIINYTDLLAGMELEPNEANDYVKILKSKGERLKNLTRDLFDISKAQSGNEQVNLERIDISLLMRQALGESDELVKSSGLEFITDLEDGMFIRADGKKMSRVFENLINNAVKYSMKNTRVYLSAAEEGNKIAAEIKNISAYPLNFDVREITERFVRGDESRSAEGNGLGLAIAKSYTELCGGSFEIITDGDLFKARLLFDKN